MKVFDLVIDGKSYRVEIEDPNARPLRVAVNGKIYVVETQNPSAEPSPIPAKPAAALSPMVTPAPTKAATRSLDSAAGGKVTAPLPGKVLSLAVKVGDRVKQGDEVCILESMKMEQSIKSPFTGAVKAVFVDPGQSVGHGQTLLELA